MVFMLVYGFGSLLLEVCFFNIGVIVLYYCVGFVEIGWCKCYYLVENNMCEDVFVMCMVCEVSGVEVV